MSAWVKCEFCGRDKEIPAYEGDGVYTEHYCGLENKRQELSADAYKTRRDAEHEE